MSRINSFRLGMAARWVRSGGVIAYPTEAVFGLGCNPADPLAVARVLSIKKRPIDKGLILVASDQQQLAPWIRPVSDADQARLKRSWPGPNTWLVPAADNCPDWLTGKHSTQAVRVTAHPLVRALCDRLNSALVSTSANVSNLPPARSVLEVQLRFAAQVDYILPGQLGGDSQPTSIRDLLSGHMIRK